MLDYCSLHGGFDEICLGCAVEEAQIKALEWAESIFDKANDFPCRFCGADRYDGQEGIVHMKDCPMRQIREQLAHLRREDEEEEPCDRCGHDYHGSGLAYEGIDDAMAQAEDKCDVDDCGCLGEQYEEGKEP